MHAIRLRTIFHLMLLASLLVTVLGSMAHATPARAAIIVVTSTADAGAGTLRQAVVDAAPGDTIIFGVTGTITLTSFITITKNLTITGPGAASMTISGGGVTRLFDIGPFTVNISGVTIANGFSGISNGGGIQQLGGSLTVNSVTFRDNQAPGGYGGGIYQNGGALTVTNSTISGGNAIHGGGIMAQNAQLTVSNSTITSNTATHWGGGIQLNGNDVPANTLMLTGSTFSGNSASNGGGLYIFLTQTATVANSTFSANTATENGGGLFNSVPGTLTLVNSTFSGNSATVGGGGVFNFSNLSMVNNILANSPLGGDCVFGGGTWGTLSNNLIESGNCPFTTTLDPALGSLRNNGGPTETFALLSGSPALDAGDNTACGAASVNNRDQRGVGRPADGDGNGSAICDLGSFEALEPTVTTISADAPDPSVPGQSVSVSVTVAGTSGAPGGMVEISGADSDCNISLVSGSGSCTVRFTSAGDKTLAANYSGDSSHSSSEDTESHRVNPADTTTTITADSPDPSQPGYPVSVSYMVMAETPGSGTPTGNVTVSDGFDSCIDTVEAGGCVLSLATGGLRTLTATYEGDSNFNGSSDAQEHIVDGAPPLVANITRADANPTNADNVDFTVTFTETVMGVDGSDFSLATGGSLGGVAVSGVGGTGAVYTVSVDTGNGSGSLRLDVDDMAIIQDLAGNYLPGAYAGGESYTIDKDAPQIASSLRLGANPTGLPSVEFRVTFNEAVTGVDGADFGLATDGSLSGSSVSGVSGTQAAYTVTVETGSGSGSLRLDVDDMAIIQDLAGNNLPGAYTGGESYTIDRDAPSVRASVRIDASPTNAANVNFRVTFNEAVSGVDISDFTITTTGSLAGSVVSGVAGSGTTYTVTVNTGSGDGTLRLDLVNNDTILDLAFNALSAGYTGGESYTVEKTAPAVSSSLRADPNPTRAPSVDFVVAFSEAVSGVDVSDFTITTTGSLAGSVVSGVAGSGTTYTVTVNTGSGDGMLRLDVVDNATILDLAFNALSAGYTGGESYTVDKTAPVVSSSLRADPNPTRAPSVDFIVSFSEAVSGVDVSDFTITTTGSLAGSVVSSVAGSGTTYTVTISIGSGAGNLRLDVVDDDTIMDATGNPLAGAYTRGEAYEVGFYFTLLPLMVYDSSGGGR